MVPTNMVCIHEESANWRAALEAVRGGSECFLRRSMNVIAAKSSMRPIVGADTSPARFQKIRPIGKKSSMKQPETSTELTDVFGWKFSVAAASLKAPQCQRQ